MFGNLTNYSHTRTHGEAFGFFLFTTILLVGLSTIMVPVLGMVGIDLGTVSSTIVTGVTVHTLISTLFVLLMSSLILVSKRLTGDLLSIILTVVGVYATYHISVVLGMVVVAYLTTIKIRD